ncbi:hypothetical protein NDA16_005006 [Ustilago loliicola]|nr:hypothetical protein NDA16_005006 [Ustilago loliicola]
MTETASRRSARNAGKPAPAPAAASASAPAKRKSTDTAASAAVEKKSKPAPTGALKIGDSLPSLALKLQDGSSISTSSLKSSVIFTYPRANTSGCTTQAKLFRDNHSSFTSSSYTVYGLSNDSPTSLKSWKEKQNFPYDLISDPKRELIKALTGADDKTKRSHFVIDDQGKLALAELSVKPVDSCPSALKFVQNK